MNTRTTTDRTRSRAARAQLNAEIEGLLLEVRGLVLVKGVLKKRGATRSELDAHAREIDRTRRRLADLVGPRGLEAGTVLGEAA
jgi:hypothetical protein